MLALEPAPCPTPGPRSAPGAPPLPAGAPIGGATVVRAEGEIDIATAGALRGRLLDALDDHDTVAVDMSAVTFLDCAGLRALLAARDHADRNGRRLVVRDPSRPVRRLLTWTRLDRSLRATTWSGVHPARPFARPDLSPDQAFT